MVKKTESRIQQEIFVYHANHYPKEYGLLFMVHNEASSRIRGARLKSQGMVAGVSDMIYLNPKTKVPIFMEIKTEKGRQTESQKKWELIVQVWGVGEYHIVRSLEQAKQICKWTR